ncbi:uncharacterized protein LOC111111529 [Crassostrea virginica]
MAVSHWWRLVVYVLVILDIFPGKVGANVAQCVIVQEKETIDVPFGQNMLRCGQTNIYLKPECVCTFNNVFEAKNHGYSSCPNGVNSDIVTQLKCPDCKKYSLNNKGPCINGGTLICKGDEVAPEVTCQCPSNYEGRLCENRIENITRICDRISNASLHYLKNCTSTSKKCVTYSRNELYAYVCQENNTPQYRQELPLCLDTESTTKGTIPSDPNENNPEKPHASCFLKGTLQNYTRKYNLPIDQLTFHFHPFPHFRNQKEVTTQMADLKFGEDIELDKKLLKKQV